MNASPQRIAGRYIAAQASLASTNDRETYECTDAERDSAPVIVKILRAANYDELDRAVVDDEFAALRLLASSDIVRITDYGYRSARSGPYCYVVRDRYPHTLVTYRTHLTQAGSAPRRFAMMRQLARALANAHAQTRPIIHGHIAPSNIVINDDNNALLADTGLLTIGRTLSHSTALPYAADAFCAPEVQRGETPTVRSDIYSLGATFAYLLAGRTPPADTPLSEFIATLGLPASVRMILERMIITDPVQRLDDGAQVAAMLDAITDYGIPTVALVVDAQRAVQLAKDGYISDASFTAARTWFHTRLGTADVRPIALAHAGPDTFYLLVGHTRVRCRQRPATASYSVTAVDDLQPEEAQRLRDRAQRVYAQWEIAPDEASVSHLLGNVTRYEGFARLNAIVADLSRAAGTAAERRQQSREVLTASQEYLSTVDRHLHRRAQVRYTHTEVDVDSGVQTFHVEQPPPDSDAWRPGEQIAVRASETGEETVVGDLVSCAGCRIQVRPHGPRLPQHAKERVIPASGFVLRSTIGSHASINRQRRAIVRLATGDTANRRLREVIENVALARFGPPITDLTANLSLDDSQWAAVRGALRAEDLYLLQGPPGTGKTRTITEIVLQLTARTRSGPILLASQSHAALDHLVNGVATDSHATHIKALRIGDDEDIADDCRWLTRDAQCAAWRETVLARCRERLAAFDHEEHRLWGVSGTDVTPAEIRANIDYVFQEVDALARAASTDGAAPDWDAQMAAGHALIYEALPPDQRGAGAPDRHDEHERLRAVIAHMHDQHDTLCRRRSLVERWCATFGTDRDLMAEHILHRADVIGATCSAVGGKELRDLTFDCAIIDEAARALPSDILVPLVQAQRAILVGDERQLQPHIDHDIPQCEFKAAGLNMEDIKTSLFKVLVEQAERDCKEAVTTLTVQYRMHPHIGNLIGNVFYPDKGLRNGVSAEQRAHGLPNVHHAVIWVSTAHRDGRYECHHGHGVYTNETEIDIIDNLVAELERAYTALHQRRQVAIIAGYKGQVDALKGRLLGEGHQRTAIDLEVETVDSFQGKDRHIVIYSTTRSNAEYHIGHLKEHERLNVALSRAQQLLYIVGDTTTLSEARIAGKGRTSDRANNPYARIFDYMRAHPKECLIEYA